MSARTILGFRTQPASNDLAKAVQNPYAVPTSWVRNPSWPSLATPGSNEILALYAAFGETGAPDFIAFTVSVSTGTVRVQLGDGTDTTVTSGSAFNATINYSALSDLGLPYRVCSVRITPNTGGATFTSFDLSTRHSTISALSNPIANWLEIKANFPTAGGNTISTNSSGTKAPYLQNVELDGAISTPNIFGSSARNLRRVVLTSRNTVNFSMNSTFISCRQLTDVSITLGSTGKPDNLQSLFSGCASLVDAPFFDTSAVTNFGSTFNGCVNLRNVPCYDTSACTSFNGTFNTCRSIKTVPCFNSALVQFWQSMFTNCVSLEEVPLFNTSSATNMSSMFNGCSALKAVPAFNTASVTDMNSMFSSCSSLQQFPPLTYSAVTNGSALFSGCSSLITAPSINFSAATNLSTLFSNCSSLRSVGTITTSSSLSTLQGAFQNCENLADAPTITTTTSVTNMSAMFSGCTLLSTVPAYTTSAVTNAQNMFNACASLRVVPALNFNAVTTASNLNGIFTSTFIQRIQATNARITHTVASNMLSATALNEYYTGLQTITGQTLTVTSNYGTTGDDPSIATAKGWTVTGS